MHTAAGCGQQTIQRAAPKLTPVSASLAAACRTSSASRTTSRTTTHTSRGPAPACAAARVRPADSLPSCVPMLAWSAAANMPRQLCIPPVNEFSTLSLTICVTTEHAAVLQARRTCVATGSTAISSATPPGGLMRCWSPARAARLSSISMARRPCPAWTAGPSSTSALTRLR